jgi:signal transduction histidine kinase
MRAAPTQPELVAIFKRIASAFSTAQSEQQAAGTACELMLEITGLDQAQVGIAGRANRPEVLHTINVTPAYGAFLREQYMNLPGARIIATGQPHVVTDAWSDPDYAPFVETYRTHGIRGMVLVPVRHAVGGGSVGAVVPQHAADTELFGVLGAYHPSPITIEPVRLALASVVASQLAVTLINLRLFETREHYKRQAMLERNQEILGTLTAGIAHDLNNVLGAVLGASTVLADMPADRQSALLAQLGRQAENAADLTRSLLEISRVRRTDEGGGMCDLVTVTSQAIHMVQASSHPNTTFELESERPAIWAAIDAMAFSRIILNLLLNAVQALGPHGGGRVRVRIRIEGEDDLVEVDDDGPGVDPAHRDTIFEPFESFGKSSGTGVGLATARGLAERAGGSLDLRHRPGPGACFVVAVPGLAAEAPIAASESTPTSTGSASGGKHRGRILVADDEPAQRMMFSRALSKAGFEVVEAQDGEAAEDCLRSGEFSAIVLDQRMPRSTGVEVLERARAAGITAPAVVLSGFNIDPARMARLEHVHIVPKPLSGETLVRLVVEGIASGTPSDVPSAR